MSARRRDGVLALAVALVSALPYLAAGLARTFTALDDNLYVLENPLVRGGLSGEGIRRAFGAYVAGNWHPLTLVSHMLDVSLFGLDPRGHHLTSIALHAAAAALLFLALARMTGAPARSAFVAALFGVHPLHVESVAWISERKGVLAGACFMLVLLAHERYARRGGAGRYLAVALALALGLMAKPVLVTAPFVLLLLDVWPLGRAPLSRRPGGGAPPLSWGRLLSEKLPLLALAAAAGALTVLAQRAAGTIVDRSLIPVPARLANAAISYAAYLGKTVWPASLAVYYPHPMTLPPWWKIAGALLALVLLSALALAQLRRRPTLAVGWLWYLGILVPVIGIVQVGEQAMADRYTYLPLIGVFVAASWSAFPGPARRSPRLPAVVAAVLVAALAVAAAVQARYWRDSETLLGRTLAVTADNAKIETNLGGLLIEQGRFAEAAARFREAVRITPRSADAHYNLALALAGLGRRDEEIASYRAALGLRRDHVEARFNLAFALAEAGQPQEAVTHYREVLRLRPGLAEAHGNLAAALAGLGRLEEAAAAYREALRIRPGDPSFGAGLRAVLARLGR